MGPQEGWSSHMQGLHYFSLLLPLWELHMQGALGTIVMCLGFSGQISSGPAPSDPPHLSDPLVSSESLSQPLPTPSGCDSQMCSRGACDPKAHGFGSQVHGVLSLTHPALAL